MSKLTVLAKNAVWRNGMLVEYEDQMYFVKLSSATIAKVEASQINRLMIQANMMKPQTSMNKFHRELVESQVFSLMSKEKLL